MNARAPRPVPAPLSVARRIAVAAPLFLALAATVPGLGAPAYRPAAAQAPTQAPTLPAQHRVLLPWSARSAVLADADSVPTAHATDAPPTLVPSHTATATPEPTATSIATPTVEPNRHATSAPTPTATPLPTATATPPLRCQELVTNGDFEAGAKRWSLIITSTRQQAARSIQNATRLGFQPHSGTYAAWLGALADSTMDLQSDPLVHVDPARIVSATLSAAVVIVKNGVRNRRADDTFAIVLEGPGGETRPESLRLHDESWDDPWKWHVRQADVTNLLQRGAFTRLHARVQTDASDETWFYFDDISLRACTQDG
ncbi:MAG: hypothetical protein IT332_02980 [Ardenticatenales bacterium]|nr:hypothetical protein [Ardenticatenales bacterium]